MNAALRPFSQVNFHMNSKSAELSVKTVIIGDSGVGKTCLLTRFIRDVFDEGSQPTLGVEFMAKVVATPKRRIELQLWDTAGQELFRSVTRGYYRGALVAYLVYDITSQGSFQSLSRWIDDLKQATPNDVITILIGNKSDMAANRQVSVEEAEKFAQEHNMKYFEASAKNGERVAEAITSCLPVIDEKVDNGALSRPTQTESIIYEQENKKSGGCC